MLCGEPREFDGSRAGRAGEEVVVQVLGEFGAPDAGVLRPEHPSIGRRLGADHVYPLIGRELGPEGLGGPRPHPRIGVRHGGIEDGGPVASVQEAHFHIQHRISSSSVSAPSWLAFLTPAELSGLGALAYQSAGQFARAEQHALQTLDLLDDGFNRNRTYYAVLLAELQLAQGEYERAAASAATIQAGHVASSRISARLARVTEASQGGCP